MFTVRKIVTSFKAIQPSVLTIFFYSAVYIPPLLLCGKLTLLSLDSPKHNTYRKMQISRDGKLSQISYVATAKVSSEIFIKLVNEVLH